MPSKKNLEQVTLIKEKLAQAKSVAVVDYQGTTAKEQVQLRATLKKAGGELFVTKNTLIKIAVANKDLDDALEGMNALVFSFNDEVGAIKEIFKFFKDSEKIEIKKGLMDGKVLSFDELEALSEQPSKDQLIATLIARLKGPSAGLVNVLRANLRDLMNVLKAISEKTNIEAKN